MTPEDTAGRALLLSWGQGLGNLCITQFGAVGSDPQQPLAALVQGHQGGPQAAPAIVRDGEGMTKFFEVQVKGARSAMEARLGARAVPCWGR